MLSQSLNLKKRQYSNMLWHSIQIIYEQSRATFTISRSKLLVSDLCCCCCLFPFLPLFTASLRKVCCCLILDWGIFCFDWGLHLGLSMLTYTLLLSCVSSSFFFFFLLFILRVNLAKLHRLALN